MRKRQQQVLVPGAVGINTKQEFADLLHKVLEIANDGLNRLRTAAATAEDVAVDEIAEWSGLSRGNVNTEAEQLRSTVARLYSRAFRHYLAVSREAKDSPNTPPDIWCARKGQAALKLNNGIVTCLESAPLGIGKEIARQLRAKLEEGGEEAKLTAAAAMLLDAGTNGLFER